MRQLQKFADYSIIEFTEIIVFYLKKMYVDGNVIKIGCSQLRNCNSLKPN